MEVCRRAKRKEGISPQGKGVVLGCLEEMNTKKLHLLSGAMGIARKKGGAN